MNDDNIVSGTIDLNQAREKRETTKLADRVEGQMSSTLDQITDGFQSMMNEEMLKLVRFSEQHFPPGSVLNEAWFQSNVSSLVGVMMRELPFEVCQEYFRILCSWMHVSHLQQHGVPPNYRAPSSNVTPDQLVSALNASLHALLHIADGKADASFARDVLEQIRKVWPELGPLDPCPPPPVSS